MYLKKIKRYFALQSEIAGDNFFSVFSNREEIACPNMISNAFVFCSNQIQFVSFDKNKKRLIANLKKDIEPGLIIRGKIQNKEQIFSIVSQIIKEVKIDMEGVILVVSEDTAISKSLDLPKMSITEIDEAVRWEAEKFLPYKLDSQVLDWQLISHNGENHILFEAISKELVDDYIEIFEKLKLEVIAIETPALSLVRISQQNDEAKILVYVSNEEAVLTLAKNKQVMATSILKVDVNINKKLIDTISKMISYYKKFEVKRIQIGGMGVNSTMVQELSELKLQIDGFSIPFAVKPEIANNFLLAISASLKEGLLPESEETINLLPDWYVKKNRKKGQISFWKKMTIFIFVILIINTIMLLGIYYWIVSEEKKQMVSNRQIPASRKDALTVTRNTNNSVKTILKLIEYDYVPNDFTKLIVEKAGKDINLMGISLRILEGKGVLSGISKNRDVLIKYKQELENIEGISQVQLPVSSFTEEENIPFQLNFLMDETKIRKEEE